MFTHFLNPCDKYTFSNVIIVFCNTNSLFILLDSFVWNSVFLGFFSYRLVFILSLQLLLGSFYLSAITYSDIAFINDKKSFLVCFIIVNMCYSFVFVCVWMIWGSGGGCASKWNWLKYLDLLVVFFPTNL